MTLTWISRFFLLLVVAIYYLVGSFLVFRPQTVGIVGLDFVSPETTTAIRVWGGFFYGTAIIGTFGVLRERFTMQSLVAVTIISACVVTLRLTGIAIDGVDDRQLGELQDESLGLTLAIIGLVCAWLGGRQKAESPQDQ
jgi:hypothetical protein